MQIPTLRTLSTSERCRLKHRHCKGPLEIAYSSPPCSEHGHLNQVALDHVQSSFKYLQGWRVHNLSGQYVPVFEHPHSKFFLGLNGIYCISAFAHCLLSCYWLPLRKVWSLFLPGPHQVLIHIDKILPAPSFSRINSLSCLSLSSYFRFSNSFISFC